ncbi:unnamed protein product [Amoebophrya sp. A25]|nr:unnamed protein product [Amoebophrya sp. A25]|eukprot:GSA25T00004374001.1
MPPRGRRNNRHGGAGAAPGGEGAAAPGGGAAAAPGGGAANGVVAAGAAAARENAQNAPFPLFKDGRSFNQLQCSVANLEMDRAEKTTRRKVNNLVLNVWDMCGAKRTQRAAIGGIPSDVKRNILEFMGDEKTANFANFNIKWNAKRLLAIAEQVKLGYAEKIVENLLKECEGAARRAGNTQVSVTWEKGVAGTQVGGPISGMEDYDAGKLNLWTWTFTFFGSTLGALIGDAGFRYAILKSNPEAEKDEDKRCGKKCILRIEWGRPI